MVSTALGDSGRRAVAAGPHSHPRLRNLSLTLTLTLCVIGSHGGLRGCAVAVSPGDGTDREDSLVDEVLPRCREDFE